MRCTVLAIATEWSSGHGGLSTFNRALCLALARAGARVFCVVERAQPEEVEAARTGGVRLLIAPRGQGRNSGLTRRPALPSGVRPDLVIGHGRITGREAQIVQADFFEDAQRLHLIHMSPDEIERYKRDREDDAAHRAEDRTADEVALGLGERVRTAVVGPKLHERYLNEFSPHEEVTVLRLDPGFDTAVSAPRQPPKGTLSRILLVGRMEDEDLKGLDLAVRACGLVAKWSAEQGLGAVELLVRGVPEGEGEAQQRKLEESSGYPGLSVVVRRYSSDEIKPDEDLKRVQLAIMPSRSEGFGLVGLEAITKAVPVLVTRESGLAKTLGEVLGPAAARHVVSTTKVTDDDVEHWARRIWGKLQYPPAAFTEAWEVLQALSAEHTWAVSVENLLADLGY